MFVQIVIVQHGEDAGFDQAGFDQWFELAQAGQHLVELLIVELMLLAEGLGQIQSAGAGFERRQLLIYATVGLAGQNGQQLGGFPEPAS